MTDRMDPSELRARREYLGFTAEALGRALQGDRPRPVREDTVRAWESGRDPIPYAIADEVAWLERATAEVVETLRADPEAQDLALDDDGARFVSRWPWATARWWRHCVIRART